ncbi:dihydroxyacetone kinase phosphoryl donor subunit DhaM [Mesobacillus subterraneus]|uniref:phosphoenolpyruvate--glycerone phosphotransferase n=1 Tax=Mesobacillus subterraneus TaxID=285983 RepID=A0A0D6Z7Q8_9BACI|nr:dihydroxyacetone kinase phosphoryl donor subunit DhaM [Mesobacillus subterraneus]KIY21784.1 dihydroxyacetone kinase [Mesobacillus subterraneus]
MTNVGIVLVSHSLELVKGLEELLNQIKQSVPIAIAGGTDENEIGTDVFKIKQAIQSVYSEKGVAVLFDLGSALINAELALEMLDDTKYIKIADAPLVEGAYAAVVQSGIGGTLVEVIGSAEETKNLQKIIR